MTINKLNKTNGFILVNMLIAVGVLSIGATVFYYASDITSEGRRSSKEVKKLNKIK